MVRRAEASERRMHEKREGDKGKAGGRHRAGARRDPTETGERRNGTAAARREKNVYKEGIFLYCPWTRRPMWRAVQETAKRQVYRFHSTAMQSIDIHAGARPDAGRRREARVCVIVPAYGEERRIGGVVGGIREYCRDVVVVDDGSKDGTGAAAREAGATVLQHIRNRGKGMALCTGFAWAREEGFDAAITMYADGRHAAEDIPAFLAMHARTGAKAIVGNRREKSRTERWMSKRLSKIMRQWVPDTQCGFRLYAREAFPETAPGRWERRFAAESAELVRLALAGMRIESVEVRTIYGDERSKIRPVRDAVRFWWMLGRFRRMARKAEKERAKR